MSVTDDKTTPASFSAGAARRAIELARQTLQIEADAILALKDRLRDDSADPLALAVQTLLQCEGRAVVSGIGKSGHVGRKIAATLASTGTPSLFMHPAEAAHGDLGMVTARDVFIAISNSGETAELLAIVPIVKRMGAVIIAMTGNDQSTLAKLSAVHLNVGVAQEACTLNLAPTASTTATLAMGDALAVSLLDARGFVEEDFARSHPGGALGRRLLTHVRDVMRSGEAIPAVRPDVSLSAALMEITRKGMAMTAVVDEQFRPIGVFTDDQTQIHMYGNANAIRAPYKGREQMHLVSEYLLLLPDDEIVKTDKPVAMTMGTTRLNGVGMVANNATQVVQLFGNVRGYYEPTPKKR